LRKTLLTAVSERRLLADSRRFGVMVERSAAMDDVRGAPS